MPINAGALVAQLVVRKKKVALMNMSLEILGPVYTIKYLVIIV